MKCPIHDCEMERYGDVTTSYYTDVHFLCPEGHGLKARIRPCDLTPSTQQFASAEYERADFERRLNGENRNPDPDYAKNHTNVRKFGFDPRMLVMTRESFLQLTYPSYKDAVSNIAGNIHLTWARHKVLKAQMWYDDEIKGLLSHDVITDEQYQRMKEGKSAC